MDKIYKLGEICEIKGTGIVGWRKQKGLHNQINWKNGTIPYYQIKDIQNQILYPERKLLPEVVAEWTLTLTTENSLLLSTIGTIGKVFYSQQKNCAFASTIICLEPNLNLVEPNYLYYLLHSQEKKIKSLAYGSAVPMLTKTALSTLLIRLPSLQEQTQILQKFQIVYDKLFKSEIVYNNRLLEIIKTILEYADLLFLKYRDSEIKIKDYFKLVRGKTPSTKNPEYYENGTIKWINSGVLTNLYFLTEYTSPSKLVTEKAVKECGLAYAQINSTLISIIRISEFDKVAWVQKNDFSLGTGICNFVIKERGNQKEKNATLFFALRSLDLSAYSIGSMFPSIQTSVLINMKINWVSNPAHQKKFFTILDSKLAKIRDLHSQIRDLHSQIRDLHSQIRDLLLLKYFGKKN